MSHRQYYKTAPIELKPFTEGDWEVFAGAEELSDGSEPLIGEIEVETQFHRHERAEGLIVVDRSGKEAAIGIAKSVESPITARKLLRMGFSVI